MKQEATSWVRDVAPGERIVVGGNIVIRVEAKSGSKARIRIEAPAEIAVSQDKPGAAQFARQGIGK